MSVGEILDDVLGHAFTIECWNIVLRGRDDSIEPYFSGPGVISGGVDTLSVTVHNSINKDPAEVIRLQKQVEDGLMMCFDAKDYHNREWTGGWLSPLIYGPTASRCIVNGKFPQLSTDVPLTPFDDFRNSTAIYYPGDLRLPMLEVATTQRMRGKEVEKESTHWDRTKLELEGAEVLVLEDEEESRTIVAMQHSGQLKPPDCEAALSDAIGFVCAMAVRPRVTVRYLDNRALVFIREGRSDFRTGLPRPIAYHGPRDQDFWNLFSAFLRDCSGKNAFEGTPLGKLFSELVYASTGTIHGLVLSLAVVVDDLVAQIVGQQPRTPGIDELKAHIAGWTGDQELKESAIGLVMSILSRPSTQQHLTNLVKKGVVTPQQVAIWKQLRPKVAHGKVAEYNEDLWQKRNALIGMVYRLAARVLRYKGPLTDHTESPPTEYDFDWAD